MRASDRGEPPSYADVDVELDVVDRNNKPPLWDVSVYGPIHIKENVTVGTVVTSVKARLVSKKSSETRCSGPRGWEGRDRGNGPGRRGSSTTPSRSPSIRKPAHYVH